MEQKLHMQLTALRATASRSAYRHRVGMVLAVLAAVFAAAVLAFVPSTGEVGTHPHGYRPSSAAFAKAHGLPADDGHTTPCASIVRPAKPGEALRPIVPAWCSHAAYEAVQAALAATAATCTTSGQGASAWVERNAQMPHGYEVLARCEGSAR